MSTSVHPSILLVEDKDSLRHMLKLALEQGGYTVVDVPGAVAAREALAGDRVSLVLSDLRLGDGDGFDVLRASKDADPDTPVVVMTAYGGVEDAVRAMREGALDFIAKPVDPEHLLMLVGRAIEQRRVLTENQLLREELAARRGVPHIIGEHESLRKALQQVQRGASGDSTTILIEGESGTGKELIARAVHSLSARSRGPFVAINCAAIPETLLESELFGYEKGAFTGATQRKPGRFEVAHRGTLFLDEIGDMPLALQAKVLRVIEERRFERVGGNATVQVDVRLVAATNRHLRQMVAAKRFREDLYFRLSVFPIAVPALRERPTDIPLLAQHFVERFGRDLKKRLTLAPAAVERLMAYPWPGNVRELQNCLERAVIVAEGSTIHPTHLHLQTIDERAAVEDASKDQLTQRAAGPFASFDWNGSLSDVSRRVLNAAEKHRIALALAEAAGDRAQAADALQVPLRFLQTKIKDYGL